MTSSEDHGAGGTHAYLRVRLKYADVDTFIEKFSPGITREGVFIPIRSRKPPPGTPLRFELSLESGEPIIRGRGEVTWVKEQDPAAPGEPFGIGVRFTGLDAKGRALVERAVAYRRLTAEGGRRLASPTTPPVTSAPRSKLAGPPTGQIRRVQAALDAFMEEADRVEEELVRKVARAKGRTPEGDRPSAVSSAAGGLTAASASASASSSASRTEPASSDELDLDAEIGAALGSVMESDPEPASLGDRPGEEPEVIAQSGSEPSSGGGLALAVAAKTDVESDAEPGSVAEFAAASALGTRDEEEARRSPAAETVAELARIPESGPVAAIGGAAESPAVDDRLPSSEPASIGTLASESESRVPTPVGGAVPDSAPASGDEGWMAAVDRWAETADTQARAGKMESRPVRVTPVVGVRIPGVPKSPRPVADDAEPMPPGGAKRRSSDRMKRLRGGGAVTPAPGGEGSSERIKELRVRITREVEIVDAPRRRRRRIGLVVVLVALTLGAAVSLLVTRYF